MVLPTRRGVLAGHARRGPHSRLRESGHVRQNAGCVGFRAQRRRHPGRASRWGLLRSSGGSTARTRSACARLQDLAYGLLPRPSQEGKKALRVCRRSSSAPGGDRDRHARIGNHKVHMVQVCGIRAARRLRTSRLRSPLGYRTTASWLSEWPRGMSATEPPPELLCVRGVPPRDGGPPGGILPADIAYHRCEPSVARPYRAIRRRRASRVIPRSRAACT